MKDKTSFKADMDKRQKSVTIPSHDNMQNNSGVIASYIL